MNIHIRNMTTEDAVGVNELSSQLGYPLSLDETRNNISELLSSREHCMLVAVFGNRIAGWIHACRTIRVESPPFIEIGGLVVDKGFRQQGVGRQLVQEIQKWCASQNNKTLRVRCNTKRTGSHEFYRKLGFTETKEQKVFEKKL